MLKGLNEVDREHDVVIDKEGSMDGNVVGSAEGPSEGLSLGFREDSDDYLAVGFEEGENDRQRVGRVDEDRSSFQLTICASHLKSWMYDEVMEG